ncbi:MAG: hypothetical protein J6W02_08730, partial [Bacteroidaceae bacterium]|nr:hypothetical protein [Bacteroidaceae bacterium]
ISTEQLTKAKIRKRTAMPRTLGPLQLLDPSNSRTPPTPLRGERWEEMGREWARGEATLLTNCFIWCVIIITVDYICFF